MGSEILTDMANMDWSMRHELHDKVDYLTFSNCIDERHESWDKEVSTRIQALEKKNAGGDSQLLAERLAVLLDNAYRDHAVLLEKLDEIQESFQQKIDTLREDIHERFD